MAFPTPTEIPNTSLPLPDPEAYPDEPREYARALMQGKDEIEREISALRDVLQSHGSDMTSSLIDPEGYPRGDIDIYAIRHARAALARLNTDLRTVTDRLPSALEAAFTRPSGGSLPIINGVVKPTPNGRASSSVSVSSTGATASDTVAGGDEWPDRPVARVNSVDLGSPASDSGLKAGDLIYVFEGVTHVQGIQAIGTVVRDAGSGSTSLRLLVTRDGSRVTLSLTPRVGWGGRGSLGCHIVPP